MTKKQLSEEEIQINEIILNANKMNVKPEYLKKLKEKKIKKTMSSFEKMNNQNKEESE